MSDRQRPEDGRRRVSRRDLLKGGLAAIGAAGVAGVTGAGLSRSAGASIDRAVALSSGGTLPSLTDIQHVVILMQENRSFDHYFGTLSGVRGFSDPNVLRNSASGKSRPVWKQFGYKPGVGVDPTGFLEPFHLIQDPPTEDGATTNDISHEWTTQHELGRRCHGQLRRRAPGRRRGQQLRRDHGLLHAQRPVVLLRAGRRLHHL